MSATSAAGEQTNSILKQKMRVLEARLEYLESKLLAFEKAAAGNTRQKTETKPNSSKVAAARVDEGTPSLEPSSNIEGAKPRDAVPQETFVFRDQAPTLKKGAFEIAADINYLRANGFLQTDRVATAATTARYGLADGLEIYATLPYFQGVRSSVISLGDVQTTTKGFGSATFGASYSLLNEASEHPGVAVSVTGIYPGEGTPYLFPATYKEGDNPIDTTKAAPSSGHWGVATNLVAYKVVEPLVIYAGIGAVYFFPREFSGHAVSPAVRYTFNMGFNFALSEKTTLGFDLRSAYAPDFKVDGATARHSSQEQHVGRVVLTQRVAEQLWLEPSIGMGLTKDSPDLNLGVAVRKRY